MSAKKTDTYTSSISRLKALVERLESAQVDVDELEAVVKESVELVTVCRTRLRSTQTSVEALLVGLQDDAAIGAATVDETGPSSVVGKHPVRSSASAIAPVDEIDPFADE